METLACTLTSGKKKVTKLQGHKGNEKPPQYMPPFSSSTSSSFMTLLYSFTNLLMAELGHRDWNHIPLT
jgi:hypothetical protein